MPTPKPYMSAVTLAGGLALAACGGGGGGGGGPDIRVSVEGPETDGERNGVPARARRVPDGPESATFRHTLALRIAPDGRRARPRCPGGRRRLATAAGTTIIVQEAPHDTGNQSQ